MADQENIKAEYNSATTGLNMDSSINQIGKGQLTYALNASVENFDSNSVTYQNEPGTEFCVVFPSGYVLIGNHYIQERNKHIFFLVNPEIGLSEIGYMDNNDCQYKTLVNSPCLAFDINKPIHKIVHKITNCSVEIYWADHIARRYLDIDNLPMKLAPESSLCDPRYTNELDCNQLKMQPNFSIPEIEIKDVISGGSNKAGMYQFAIQYSDASGNAFTSYYSITNGTPISDPTITTPNFNYEVGKSIVLEISNLDTTGQFQYFNIAVIKTVNNITTPELIGTYFIDSETKTITYTGQGKTDIVLSINDIFEKFPYYDIADDVTTAQDVLIWKGLTSIDRINYQSIASKIHLQWETYKLPAEEDYSNELIASNLRGYLRDEIYAYEIVFLLRNGKQTDAFHIPGREKDSFDNSFPDVPNTNPDFIGEPQYYNPDTGIGYSPYWMIYNTARVIGDSTSLPINEAVAYKYGEFAYHESTEVYPCNDEVWGDLAGKPIRHHRFPDVNISPIFENGEIIFTNNEFSPVMMERSVFPIGVKLNIEEVKTLIQNSSLTDQQKSDIVGFKIVRGDRGTNKSIVAKGILRNVGSYEREQQTYYFPNYPYNDLSEDPFINAVNNAYSDIASPFLIICEESGKYQYTDINTNKTATAQMVQGQIYEICSTTRPIYITGKATIGPASYDVWRVSSNGCKGFRAFWSDPLNNENLTFAQRDRWMAGYFGSGTTTHARVEVGGTTGDDCDNGRFEVCKCDPGKVLIDATEQAVGVIETGGGSIYEPFVGRRSTLNCKGETPLTPIKNNNNAKYRQVFNSPETSFGQPFLGNVLKLETVVFGGGKGHFVEVKDNAKYKLLSKEAQIDALNSAQAIGGITDPFGTEAMFTAYQAYLTIYINGITRKNYAYQFNSRAFYNYYKDVPNLLGVKQREIDLKQYLIPGVQSVGDDFNINNYQRESSVYIRTDLDKNPLPFPSETPELSSLGITDKSRFTISEVNACSAPGKEQDIDVVSYYASMKNIYPGQWGQIYSYEVVDTGCQVMIDGAPSSITFFGGDTFISKFSYKTKIPFFIDNRVNAPDDSDIFYDEIGNVGYPKYWHSARSILENYTLASGQVLTNFVSYKAHHFDCANDPSEIPASSSGAYGSNRTFYDGYFYLFAYGIPYFYCETSYNLDLRQAFNNREGDFWPHVSTGIPDDWLQESFVSIANDNTYNYNVTFSKQNKENTFTHLPPDWEEKLCYTNYPFRAIYSEPQVTNSDVRINNWLIYRPLSLFDFPQNYGKLISLDGIQNKAILARFENKSLLYNNLLVMNTSNPQAAYLGNPRLFEGAPPIDFAETDLGYVGSQNKMLLKIPQGQITVDAKRGQIFLISGTQAVDLTAFGSGVNRFMTDHLAFEILRFFPKVPTDNHFTGIGLHGVYDSKFDRIIITKLDYLPIDESVKYDEDTNEFYIETELNGLIIRTQVYLSDREYFCNKSWTMSFNFNTKSWTSFHSYLPNFYIGENNFFYSGLNGCCSDLDGQFSALIGTPDRAITTTTTTTLPLTTTTTSTTQYYNCTLEGTAIEVDCTLAGTAVVIVPSPTTTTVCKRPFGLPYFYFGKGYTLPDQELIEFYNSFEEACQSAALLKSIAPNVELEQISFSANSLSIGELVYLDASSDDCQYVPDGWYLTDESIFEGFVYYVENGTIRNILSCNCGTTTTTTTLAPNIAECCGIVFVENNNLVYDELNGSTNMLNVKGFTESSSIAISKYKFWAVYGAIMKEWDITLSPFTSTFNRNISIPSGVDINSGIFSRSYKNIIAVDNSTSEIIELYIETSTAVKIVKFALENNRIGYGGMLYTLSGKLIVGNKDVVTGNYYLSQYNYSTGDLEVDLNIGDVEIVLVYECNCNIYITDANGNYYIVTKETPYDIELIGTMNLRVASTQIRTCLPNSITESANYITTTTTTTTILM